MRIFRGIVRWLSSIFLHSILILFIVSVAFVMMFSHRQPLKDALIRSGAYNELVPAFIEDNIQASDGKRTALPFDDSTVQQLAFQTFTPQVLKENAEHVVDAVYDWLEGSKDELTFRSSIDDEKNSFIDGVSTYAAQRLSSLPTCATNDLGDITVFELTCRPENVPLSYVKTRVAQDLLASDFFSQLEFSEQDLPRTKDGTLLQEKYSFTPRLYQISRGLIWVSALLLIAAMVLFVFLRRPMRKGMRRLGRELLSSVTTFMFVTILFGFILPKYTNSLGLQGGRTMEVINGAIDESVVKFDLLLINVSLQLFAGAILIIAIEKMSRPSSIYEGAAKKAGITTSVGKRQRAVRNEKLPPVQTSEVKKRPKTRKKIPSRYRKIGL